MLSPFRTPPNINATRYKIKCYTPKLHIRAANLNKEIKLLNAVSLWQAGFCMKLTVPGSASPVLDNQTASKFSCGKTAPADHPSSSHAPSEEFYYNITFICLICFWEEQPHLQTWIRSPDALRTTTPPCLKRRSAVSASVNTTYPNLTWGQILTNQFSAAYYN